MIRCGWCGKPTANRDRCTSCGHIDPERPFIQRGDPVPTYNASDVNRKRLADAQAELGPDATIERLAEHLDVSPRTVRRWREMSSH